MQRRTDLDILRKGEQSVSFVHIQAPSLVPSPRTRMRTSAAGLRPLKSTPGRSRPPAAKASASAGVMGRTGAVRTNLLQDDQVSCDTFERLYTGEALAEG